MRHTRDALPSLRSITPFSNRFPRVDLLRLAATLISFLHLTKFLEISLNAVSLPFDRKYSECVTATTGAGAVFIERARRTGKRSRLDSLSFVGR